MPHFAKRSSPSSLKLKGTTASKRCLGAVLSDSVSPAICMNEGCHYTCEMEPDQDRG
jgi:hypothetical protein